MATTKEAFRPLLISEKLVTPLTLCRAAVTGMGWAMSTMGESTTFPVGQQYGNGAFEKQLKQARKNTGEPERKGYNQSHVSDFLKAFDSPLRLKDVKYNQMRPKIRESLQGNFAISMAGSTAKTPAASKLRKWVNPVAHQLLFFDWEGGVRTGTVAFIDPMTPPNNSNYVRRVPVREMWQFGSKFQFLKRYVCERYSIGKYTRAAITRRDMAQLTLQVQEKLVAALKGWQEADAEVEELIEKYNELDAKYEACMEGQGIPVDQENEVIAHLQSALNILQD